MLYFNFNPFPVLSSERLGYRRIGLEDATDFFDLRTHPQVIRYLDRLPEKSVKDVFPIIDNIDAAAKNNTGILWVITSKDSEKMMGTIGFWKTDSQHHRAEVGYLLHPGFWGKGFMDEALKRIIKFGWQNMLLHTIEANINPENRSSKKLLVNNGFVVEGYFKESYHYDGKYLDAEILSLINK